MFGTDIGINHLFMIFLSVYCRMACSKSIQSFFKKYERAHHNLTHLSMSIMSCNCISSIWSIG